MVRKLQFKLPLGNKFVFFKAFVVGIVPESSNKLNLEQLNNLAGEAENMFVIKEGFNGLNKKLLSKLSSRICSLRTCQTELNLEALTEILPS